MEDYKNEQWWIELQKSLDGFDDSTMSDSDLRHWNGAKLGGSRGGATNAKSGHMKKIQKENAHIGGKIMGPISGKKYGIDNFKKTTFEQRSKGGKIAGRNRVLDGTLLKAAKIGAKNSAEKRINEKIEYYKEILKLIVNSEFTFSDVRIACGKYGIKESQISGRAKKILREKTLVKQIHKGYNQFNPSLYIKIY
jgi:hypothetical protein